MLDIESFNKALDDENKGKWKLFLDLELERLGGGDVFYLQPEKK